MASIKSSKKLNKKWNIITTNGKDIAGYTKSQFFTLEPGKRYAHTAENDYFITMAILQPDDRRLPNCACEKQPVNQDRVVLVVEHNLNEHILCVLDSKTTQCKLNLFIESGEQMAFRTIGRIPLMLTTRHRSQSSELDCDGDYSED